MLLKLFLITSLLCFTAFNRLKAEGYGEASGDDIDIDRGTDDGDEGSGDVTVGVNQREPPSASDDDEEPEYKEDNGGGGGIIIDDNQGEDVTESSNQWKQEPVHVQENSLMTHPGILAAIIVGGVLVLVCLIVFFVLIVCCVRKKDEGTYDLDDAMKQKLKYVAYTKAETSPDKEFFA